MAKLRITVRPKGGICDPQSRTVLEALRQLGFKSFEKCAIGRAIIVEGDEDTLKKISQIGSGEAADVGIANFNTEQFSIEEIPEAKLDK